VSDDAASAKGRARSAVVGAALFTVGSAGVDQAHW
jgi:hypothetical protein